MADEKAGMLAAKKVVGKVVQKAWTSATKQAEKKAATMVVQKAWTLATKQAEKMAERLVDWTVSM
jgi:hypothetical protein